MKTILALSLLAAAFAFVPSADAICVEDVCAYQYAYGTDCRDYAYNSAGFYVNSDAVGIVGAGVGTQCYTYWGYTYNGIGASFYSYDDAGYEEGYVYWAEDFGTCYSYVYTSANGVVPIPVCETAGMPPEVPALPQLLP